MKITCTEAEKIMILNNIAFSYTCDLCMTGKCNGDCRSCAENRIEWTIEDGDGE